MGNLATPPPQIALEGRITQGLETSWYQMLSTCQTKVLKVCVDLSISIQFDVLTFAFF